MADSLSGTDIQYWLRKLEQMNPDKIELGLDRIHRVAQRLSLGRIAGKIVTIAGTNGKGSCVRVAEQILLASGYRVGSYTSPHVSQFNERIRIQGTSASDAQLCKAFAAIETARQDVHLTYFEFTTLAAFVLFGEAQLDVALLEVGLGGRLDAVNTVDPDVAVVTSIALDHQNRLGNSREEIGFEKAGIFRAGIAAVCGDPEPPVTLLRHAAKLGAKIQLLGEDFGYRLQDTGCWYWWSETGATPVQVNDLPLPRLPVANAAVALQAIQQLGLTISRSHLEAGLNSAALEGRFQRFEKPVPTVFDVAHNAAAAAYLAARLAAQSVAGKIVVICGILADKDIDEIIAPLLPLGDAWLAADLDTERAAPAQLLVEHITNAGGRNAVACENVAVALQAAFADATADDLVVVFGSFYTVADGLKYMNRITLDG